MPEGAETRAAYCQEAWIRSCEHRLRTWFTRDADPVLRQIDALDIGWGGVQRWTTAWMPAPDGGPHLDVACGYATFLAQLGWRFPAARLAGLNIDFEGPHALARPLLARAGVQAALVRADAQQMPFGDGSFASVSCFLGLQDIQIGFGEPGVQRMVAEDASGPIVGFALALSLAGSCLSGQSSAIEGLAPVCSKRWSAGWPRPARMHSSYPLSRTTGTC